MEKYNNNIISNEINIEVYDDMELNAKIDKLLEDKGFNSSDYGTLLYKELLSKIVGRLIMISKESNNELKLQLFKTLKFQLSDNMYSEIYFDVARNDNDMGVKTYHEYVANAALKAAKAKSINVEGPWYYGALAYDLACEVLEEKPKTRKRG